jgi:hypothetical protein
MIPRDLLQNPPVRNWLGGIEPAWRRRIESGRSKSITDLAAQEKVTIAYVGKLLNLTCLAPDIVAAILDGRQPRGLSVNVMLKDVAAGWDQQREAWGFPGG